MKIFSVRRSLALLSVSFLVSSHEVEVGGVLEGVRFHAGKVDVELGKVGFDCFDGGEGVLGVGETIIFPEGFD
jgi:hypothetical protein